MEETGAVAAPHAGDKVQRRGGLMGVAKSSAGVMCLEGGAASSDKVFKSGAPEWESSMGRSGREAGQAGATRSERRG